jgi:hypothetical protein
VEHWRCSPDFRPSGGITQVLVLPGAVSTRRSLATLRLIAVVIGCRWTGIRGGLAATRCLDLCLTQDRSLIGRRRAQPSERTHGRGVLARLGG